MIEMSKISISVRVIYLFQWEISFLIDTNYVVLPRAEMICEKNWMRFLVEETEYLFYLVEYQTQERKCIIGNEISYRYVNINTGLWINKNVVTG